MQRDIRLKIALENTVERYFGCKLHTPSFLTAIDYNFIILSSASIFEEYMCEWA